jgi:hypothetical protein
LKALFVAALLLAPRTGAAAEAAGPLPLAPAPEPAAAPLAPMQAPEAPALTPTAEQPPPLSHPGPTGAPGGGLAPWFDLPHAFLERRVFDVVNGFDHFFADRRAVDCLRASSVVRLRNSARIAEAGSVTFDTDLRADIKLPNLQRRLNRFRVILERFGRSADETEPAALTGGRGPRGGDALIGWTLLDTLRSSIDLTAGLIFDLPPGLTARARFRHAQPLGGFGLGRVAATGFWNTGDGFGATASTSLERPFGGAFLARAAAGTLRSQTSAGFESAAELSLLARLGRLSAATLTGSVSTRSVPNPEITGWRTALRLRTSVFRSWIFAELEPEVRWPLDAARTWRPIPAVFLRLELRLEDHPPPPGVPVRSEVPGEPNVRGCPLDAASRQLQPPAPAV